MVFVENLLKKLLKNKVDFFTGVPDSILKNFSSYLEKYPQKKHIIATSEGSAASIAIGHYLSTKKIPCVYMQNSGLSNAMNPLISIAGKTVYSIPLFLLIGWRGSPKKSDEPQHLAKGKITRNLLRLLKIDHCVLRKESDLKNLNNLINKARKKQSIVACLIEKDTLISKNKKINKKIHNSILRADFIKEFLELIPKKSKIISTTGYTSRELMEVRKLKKDNKSSDFYMVGGMGHSSSVALGYSLSSKRKTFCLDGDGSVLMHLGSLRTIGYLKATNLKHIILNNNSHESVGGQTTTASGIDFQKLSSSLGYKSYFKIKSYEEIKTSLKKFIKARGPSLLEVKIKNGSLKNLSRPKNLINIKQNFIKN